MDYLEIQTARHKEVVDITEEVQAYLGRRNDLKNNSGIIHLFITHTTAAITTADLDPGTDLDLLDAFEAIVPKLKYRHPHDPKHVGDHIMSALIGCALSLPFESQKLVLGTWQRVVLIELDGPRERRVVIHALS